MDLRTRLLSFLPIQWNDEQAVQERVSRTTALASVIEQMGTKYLLHPANFVKKLKVKDLPKK